MGKCAPIILFTYNRVLHTQKTVEALCHNDLAKDSDLIIYSDGPKNDSDNVSVYEVRLYLKNITGFKSVEIIERETNVGLANSIISGVTEVVNKFGKVIVLEDDIVTSCYFLKFMNDCLDLYENIFEVISIHGYVYPVKKKIKENFFFLKDTGCWGWATWKRGWDLFESDSNKLISMFSQKQVRKFTFDNSYPFYQMLLDNSNGLNNSWAIRWQASAFLNNKLTIYPGKSLAMNIGFDESGTHCGGGNLFDVELCSSPIKVYLKRDLTETSAVYKSYKKYFRKITDYQTSKVVRLMIKTRLKKIKDSIYRKYELMKVEQLLNRTVNDGFFRFNNYLINYTDPVSLYFEIKDIFINEIYRFRTCKSTPVIIDAGGCIGASTLYFKSLYPDSEITVFEPDPMIFKVLKENIRNNNLENIEAINAGLGLKKGEMLFYPDNSDGGSLYKKDGIEPIKVNILQLSNYINKPIDLLKMNIEGMEGEVFEEIEYVIDNIDQIIIEYHAFHELQQSLHNILSILDRNGFRYLVTDATNAKISVPFNMKDDYKSFNLVYAKKWRK